MLYLLLSIIFATWWALSYKVATRKKCNLITVNTITFLSAALFMGIYFFLKSERTYNLAVILIGLLAGISIFIATLTFFYVIREGRLSIFWPVINLAVIIPLLASILFWKESPGIWQIIGLIIACLSLYLLGAEKEKKGRENAVSPPLKSKNGLLLFLAFFFTGILAVCAKMIQEFGLSNHKELYIFSQHCSAFLLMAFIFIPKWSRPDKKEILLGISRGMAVIFIDFFFILALGYLPGFYAFPLRSMVNLWLVVFISVLVWKECMSKKNLWGIAASILAIVLINLKG